MPIYDVKEVTTNEEFKDSFKIIYSCGDADGGADRVGDCFPQLYV